MDSAPATESNRLLFVYGSLLFPTGDAGVDAAVSGSQPLGRGYIHARLYALGPYPGAKPTSGDAGPDDRVWGRLLALHDAPAFFGLLDAYEGFDPRAPAESEFIRSLAPVVVPELGRTYLSQVYFYNQSVKGKQAIPSGDYLAYRMAREHA